MRLNLRPSALPAARFALVAFTILSGLSLLGGCSLFHADDAPVSAAPAKKGWTSILPWGGTSGGGDATPYIEYHRTRTNEGVPMYTLTAHNSHLTKTIQGQMRTSMETGPGDMKVDSQSFTLTPNEEKKLLVYPARFPLTYEVTASFRE